MTTIVSDTFTGSDPSTIFTDTFTAGANQNLEAHTPDTGTSWTELWATTAGVGWNVFAATDRCGQQTAANSGAIYTADATYPTADYDITCTMFNLLTSVNQPIYLLVRVQDQENMYAVGLWRQGGTNTCRLYKKLAGVWSALGRAFAPPANGSVIKLEIHGDVLSFYDDGALIAFARDTDITAAGKAGLACGGGTELVTSTDGAGLNNLLDNLSVNVVTTLMSHTPDVGGVWETFSTGGYASIIKTNRCQSHQSAQEGRHCRNLGDPATAEYDVSADITLGTADIGALYTLLGRVTPTGQFDADVDRYVAYYQHHSTAGSRRFYMEKWVAGVQTQIATATEDIGAGTFNFKLELRDAAKKIYLDGVQKLTSADNAITQNGRGGTGTPFNMTDTNYIDNFLVATPTVAAARRIFITSN